MSNFYTVANEAIDEFLKEDGTWTDDYTQSHHMSLQDAMEKTIELWNEQKKPTEVFEIPLNHEAFYSGVSSAIGDLQDRMGACGVELDTEIGQSDETTWTMRFINGGFTVSIKLESPESFEVLCDED